MFFVYICSILIASWPRIRGFQLEANRIHLLIFTTTIPKQNFIYKYEFRIFIKNHTLLNIYLYVMYIKYIFLVVSCWLKLFEVVLSIDRNKTKHYKKVFYIKLSDNDN